MINQKTKLFYYYFFFNNKKRHYQESNIRLELLLRAAVSNKCVTALAQEKSWKGEQPTVGTWGVPHLATTLEEAVDPG